ncbi:lipocalin family protein, partial [Salmonella enterica subsp. enterica serovar Paratyphi A]
FRFIILSVLIASAVAVCPDVTTKPDFDLGQYVGDWYEIQRIDTVFQSDSFCVRARYEALNEPGTFSIFNSATKPDGEFITITGTGYQTNTSAPASLTIQFPGQPMGSYLVLDTDYTTYTTVYSCDVILGITVEQGWLLSRTKTLSEDVIKMAMENFIKFGVDTNQFNQYYQG